jgi:hypothetical protein
MRPPFRSSPPPSPSPYRYLGRGGGERPVRVQIILALVAALVLVAVPLYLWRRPQPASIPSADAATSTGAPPAVPTPTPQVGEGAAQGEAAPGAGIKLEMSPVKTLKCQDPGPGRTPPERCDGVRFFEDGLTRAIKESAACAPPSKNGYVVSYVFEFHFGKKRTNLFFGKSTTLAKSRRKEMLRCVERSLPTPDWDRIPHQHAKYTLNTVVTYPPISASPSASATAAAEDEVAPSGAPAPRKKAPQKAAPKEPKKAPAPGKKKG